VHCPLNPIRYVTSRDVISMVTLLGTVADCRSHAREDCCPAPSCRPTRGESV